MNKTFLLTLLLLIPAMTLRAADDRFLSKAADIAWAAHPELFDATIAVPDSLAADNDAVILAELDLVNADYEIGASYAGEPTFSRRYLLVRKMVKLLTDKGVEEFSKHEFGHSSKLNAEFYKFGESKSAFGARIHKPDGSVVDVDVSKAYNVTEGKKDNGKNVIKRKIDIPGLEVGDVLEFFDYVYSWIQEYDLKPIEISVPSEYPVMNLLVELNADPNLTTYYRAYNGAPNLERQANDKGRVVASKLFKDVPSLTDRTFLSVARQVPYYFVDTRNYTSRMRAYPVRRTGGLAENLQAQYFYNQIAQTIAMTDISDNDVTRRAHNLVKDYAKAHPEADKNTLTDVAWLATNYIYLTQSRDTYSDFGLALIFADLVRRQPVEASEAMLAFTTSRNNAPLDQISSISMPDYGVMVDGRYYQCSGLSFTMAPGELPRGLSGEDVALLPSDRRQITRFMTPSMSKLPDTNARSNSITFNTTLSLTDDDALSIAGDVTMKGTMKAAVTGYAGRLDALRQIERYLGIPENERFKPRQPLETEAEISERTGDATDELEELLFADRSHSLDTHILTKYGITPDEKDAAIAYSATIDNAVTRAGDEILVPVGKFTGRNSRLVGHERERQTDIYLMTPFTRRYNVTLNVPEGYEADTASLEAFTKNVSNELGTLVAKAQPTPEGNVRIVIQMRYVYPVVPVAAWPLMLDLLDQRASLTDATIILKKK